MKRLLNAVSTAVGVVCEWIGGLFRRKQKQLKSAMVEELPDTIDTDTVYLVGEGKHLWFIAMICPCGCGETLHMNCLPDSRPRWSATRHLNGTVTLHPSVWRRVRCQSHFFMRKGVIYWCGSSSAI